MKPSTGQKDEDVWELGVLLRLTRGTSLYATARPHHHSAQLERGEILLGCGPLIVAGEQISHVICIRQGAVGCVIARALEVVTEP